MKKIYKNREKKTLTNYIARRAGMLGGLNNFSSQIKISKLVIDYARRQSTFKNAVGLQR